LALLAKDLRAQSLLINELPLDEKGRESFCVKKAAEEIDGFIQRLLDFIKANGEGRSSMAFFIIALH
jgi:hypothetical protein